MNAATRQTWTRRLTAAALIAVGIALIPLPGPGTAIVLAGLTVAGWRPPVPERLRAWTPTAVRDLLDRVAAPDLRPSLAVERATTGPG